jgi:RimJ/RimL family protein N-acetyltransferase
MRELPQRLLARLTQLDYERDMAFVAVAVEGDSDEMLGMVHAYTDHENVEAEIAVLIRSDLKGLGLGALLLEKLIRYCRGRGTQRLVAQALPQNVRMLQLAKAFGFHLKPQSRDVVDMTFALHEPASSLPCQAREPC